MLKRQIIYHIHGTKYYKGPISKVIKKGLWKLCLLNKKIKFVANSQSSKSIFLSRIGHIEYISVLYNPFNTNNFPFKAKSNSELKSIFYMGRITTGKNLLKWVDVINYINQNQAGRITGIIYGNGPEKQNLEKYIYNKSIKNISIRAFTNDPVDVYHKYDLFLFLSLHESFGNVVIESLLCGTPVLVLDIPVMNELLEDFPEFIIHQNDDLFKQIKDRLKLYHLLIEKAAEASKYFHKKMSLNGHVDQLLNIYEEK
jgi:glycosyltransferase involved in cell wall biosynthesis